MITQEQLDLIADDKAFAPQPASVEAPGLADWLAGIGFVVLFAALVVLS